MNKYSIIVICSEYARLHDYWLRLKDNEHNKYYAGIYREVVEAMQHGDTSNLRLWVDYAATDNVIGEFSSIQEFIEHFEILMVCSNNPKEALRPYKAMLSAGIQRYMSEDTLNKLREIMRGK